MGSEGAAVHAEDARRQDGQPRRLPRQGACCSSSSPRGARTAPPRRPTCARSPTRCRRRSTRFVSVERQRRGRRDRLRLPRLLRAAVPGAARSRPGESRRSPSPTTARAGRSRRPTASGYFPTFYVIDPHGPDHVALRRRAARRAAAAAAPARRRRVDPRPGPASLGATTRLYRFSHARSRAAHSRPQEKVERPADPAVRKANLRRIGRLFRDYRLKLIVVCGLIVVSACLGVVSPFLLRDILDTAIPDQNMKLLTLLAGGMILISLVTGAIGVVQSLPLDAGRPERDARPAHRRSTSTCSGSRSPSSRRRAPARCRAGSPTTSAASTTCSPRPRPR